MEDRNIDLAIAYCKGSLTRQEREELMLWVNQNIENKQEFHKYVTLYRDARSLGFVKQIDKEKAWAKINKSIHKKNHLEVRRWLPYAAAILLVATVGLTFYVGNLSNNYSSNSDSRILATRNIHPGTRKAILVLADGQAVDLIKNQEQQIFEADGTAIEKDANNNIRYNTSKAKNSIPLTNQIVVPRGGEYSLTLSDGTKVWLNSETKLKFPVRFTGDKREVQLIGEAYFEVKHNEKVPFVVHVQQTLVKALGTRFNISAYSDQNYTTTTLVDGKVEITNHLSRAMLKPGDQSISQKGTSLIKVKEVNTFLYTSWTTGVLEFENMELSNIAKQLERWYDVKISFSSNHIKDVRFTGAIKRKKPFEFTLRMIEMVADVKFSVQGKQVTVERK